MVKASMETYIIVRTHGLIQHLLRRDDYYNIIEDRADLKKYGYNVSIEKDSINQILDEIAKKFINRVLLFEKISFRYGRMSRAFIERLEIENIKARLRYLNGVEGVIEYYYPYFYYIDREDFIKARNEKQFLGLLKGTPFDIQPCLNRLMEEDRILIVKELFLDIKYFDYYLSSFRNMGKDLDIVLGYEYLKGFLYWYMIFGRERLEKLLFQCMPKVFGICFSFKKLGIPEEELSRYRRSGGETHFSDYIEKAEHIFDTKVKKYMYRNKNKIFYVYYYMLASYYEMKNLERIVLGKKIGLRQEIIKSTLRLLF